MKICTPIGLDAWQELGKQPTKLPIVSGDLNSIHSCSSSESIHETPKALKTLELVSPDSLWAHLHLSVSSPMLMTLRLSPFCELYQHACAEGSWAAFPSCPLLFQLPWRQDNGLIEVATCVQALHKPISLLFLDCSLSKLPQEYFFGKVCKYTIFHQGFWGKRNLQWIAHESSGLIHKSLYRLYFMF